MRRLPRFSWPSSSVAVASSAHRIAMTVRPCRSGALHAEWRHTTPKEAAIMDYNRFKNR